MSTVTGWGTTSSGGSTSNVLLEVDVQVISNSECNAAYGGITDNMLCAADASGNGGSDACQGDSGGPLVSCGADGNCGTTPGQNYELIGVVSFGIGCAELDLHKRHAFRNLRQRGLEAPDLTSWALSLV